MDARVTKSALLMVTTNPLFLCDPTRTQNYMVLLLLLASLLD